MAKEQQKNANNPKMNNLPAKKTTAKKMQHEKDATTKNVGGRASEDPRKNAKQKAIFTFHLILFKNAKAVENANDFCVAFCLHICLQLFCCTFQLLLLLFWHLLCMFSKFKSLEWFWTLLHDTTFKQHFMFFMLRLSLWHKTVSLLSKKSCSNG